MANTLVFTLLGVDKLSPVFSAVGNHADSAGKKMGRLEHVGKLGGAGLLALGGAAATAGLGIGAAITKAADFDKSIRTVGAIAGVSGKGLDDLSKLAIKMGQDTVFSAADASNAMVELAKGGMTAAQIKGGALQGTLTLAAAGGLQMADAATYLSNTLNMFGLTAKDSNRAVAALAGGANASSASVESLGLALSQVGPGAKLAGMSMETTVGVLAAFDNAGLKGADAGTSLKTMLMRLVPSTKAAKNEMRDLGLKFTDANGKFLPMRDIAEQLHVKLGKLSQSQKQTALTTIFGSDAFRAAAVVAGLGAKGVDKYTKASSDLGAAQKLAKVGTEGAAGAMEQFKGSVETLGIQLGMKLLPVFTKVANFVTFKMLPVIGQMIEGFGPAMKTTVGDIQAVAGAIGKFAVPIGIVAGLITAVFIPHLIALGVTAVASGLETVAIWTMIQASAIRAAAVHSLSVVRMVAGWVILGVQSLIQAAKVAASWIIAMGPIAWVGAAVAALVILIITHWSTIRDWTVRTFGGVVKTVVGVFRALPGQIGRALGNMGGWIMANVVHPIIDPFVNAAKWLAPAGPHLLIGLRNGIKLAMRFTGLPWLYATVIRPLIGPFSRAGVWLYENGKNLVTGLKNGVLNITRTIGVWERNNIINPVVRVFVAAGTWLLVHGRNLVIGLRNGIWTVARTIGVWVNGNVIQPVVRTFSRAGSWLYGMGGQIIVGLKRGIVFTARGIGGWLNGNVIQPIVRVFRTSWSWLYNMGGQLIVGLKNGVVATLKGIKNWVKANIVDPIINNVKLFFGISSPSKVFHDIGGNMVKGLFRGLKSVDMGKAIVKIFGGMPHALSSIVNKGLIALGGLPKKAMDALGSVASAAVGGPFMGGGNAPANPAGMAGLVRTAAGSRGWGSGAQWNALYNLLMGESGFNPNAQNPTSTAYGLFQFLDSTWAAVGATKTSDPWGQTAAGLRYIQNAYGSPLAAYSAWLGRSPHWYEKGTPWVPNDQLAYLHRGEAVLPAEVNRARLNGGGMDYDRLAAALAGVLSVNLRFDDDRLRGLVRVEAGTLDDQRANRGKVGRR